MSVLLKSFPTYSSGCFKPFSLSTPEAYHAETFFSMLFVSILKPSQVQLSPEHLVRAGTEHRGRRFDRPLDNLRVLSYAEGLTVVSDSEGEVAPKTSPTSTSDRLPWLHGHALLVRATLLSRTCAKTTLVDAGPLIALFDLAKG